MKFSKELMKGTTPFIILATLAELEETYGYILIKAIRDESDGLFDFPDSTLYPILYRLEAQGLVTSVIKKTPTSKERRYYSLTQAGQLWLGQRKAEMGLYVKGLDRFLQS